MSKSVYDCSIIELPRIGNEKGNITVVHGRVNLPSILQEFFIYTIFLEEKHEVHMLIKCVINF